MRKLFWGQLGVFDEVCSAGSSTSISLHNGLAAPPGARRPPLPRHPPGRASSPALLEPEIQPGPCASSIFLGPGAVGQWPGRCPSLCSCGASGLPRGRWTGNELPHPCGPRHLKQGEWGHSTHVCLPPGEAGSSFPEGPSPHDPGCCAVRQLPPSQARPLSH